ncbi:MAG: MFS transporter, partial [Gammaproteobacteria bacterium]
MAIADSLYEKLTNQEDARVCEDISEQACRETPRSFVLILLSSFLTKVGDAVASPKTTLAWVTTVVGAPEFVLGLLVPLRESGSLIPQLFIGGMIRRLAVRKWIWMLGSVLQSVAILGIGAVVLLMEGRTAGYAILGLVIAFSLARGFCSVAYKDVLGKTVPKKKRGQLTGWSASAAGIVTVAVGIMLILPKEAGNGAAVYGFLLIAAAGLWLIAAAVYAQIPEYPGATGGARSAMEALSRLRILVNDKPFRRFVITRALFMCSALSAPFYVALAQGRLGSPEYLLGAFVAASGAASLVSAPFWGRFADRSSKRVMIAAALVTAGIGITVFLVDRFAAPLAGSIWFLPLAYLVLAVAHSGVRVGRKTYVVDLATGNQRTDYVAISNSVIGVLLLIAGSVGALVPIIGNSGVIAL